MVLHAPIYLKVEYPLCSLSIYLKVNYVYPVTQHQELFEKHQSSHYENTDGAVCPSYPLTVKYPLCFFVSYGQLVT